MSRPSVSITIEPAFMEEHSAPEKQHYLFSYTITIENLGDEAFQLLERNWIITDGNGESNEVHGPGVVGEQPVIEPNESYQYTSSAAFATPIGFMEGHYLMQTASGAQFDAPIPAFRLALPCSVN
ncbi:Co2+/Mg2+ efflux protein ApaG [Corallincola luteus]|uniref:Protein ApaG n=2 Tax=Corallincola TaxID=1775176 RepID=A0A368NIG1_9GAMM|nr:MULTISPECIES: Co2+/Mg2+ efflux protein ApaG [Corallincola]RCU49946.1 Co2+/Mg2+ efflux protein ApaG [Corallincola holothuriorum]TCI03644.1 Co2+/Mg2+ efflux protein ApaG [Corallincola luteus]